LRIGLIRQCHRAERRHSEKNDEGGFQSVAHRSISLITKPTRKCKAHLGRAFTVVPEICAAASRSFYARPRGVRINQGLRTRARVSHSRIRLNQRLSDCFGSRLPTAPGVAGRGYGNAQGRLDGCARHYE
jgi:hypothetical protein